jgi:TLD
MRPIFHRDVIIAFVFLAFVFQQVDPARAASVIGGSDLLTGAYLTQVESWLVNDPQLTYNGSLTFTNIFDKQAGNTSATFHAAADGMGPTVFLMEVTVDQNTSLVGGFNPQSWSTSGYHLSTNIADRTAFIFNLTTNDRRDQQAVNGIGQYQTYNDINYGPTFGGSFDLYVQGNLSGGHTNPYSYCSNPLQSDCTSLANLLGLFGFTGFQIGQLEMFTISESSATPIPPALPLYGTGLGIMALLAWRRKRKNTDAMIA